MSAFAVAIEAFHFLRPFWLVTLVPVAMIWWPVRRAEMRPTPAADGIAPHLRAALTVGRVRRSRLLPIDGVALVLGLIAIGAAGPTWSRQPDPFVAQSAPLVIALKVTPSMEETDIAPSRLERAKQKIRDLLETRSGARTALVAYAGTAHLVVPMTEDPGVMLPYLEGLAPDIMPAEGNRAAAALDLAEGILAAEPGLGGVLFVADALDPSDAAAFAGRADIAVLAMLAEGQDDRGIDSLSGRTVLGVTPDRTDIAQIDRMLAAAQARAALADEDQPWQDRGAWLALPAALLSLLWFRRGWTMRWAALVLAVLLTPVSQARAEGVADWFFTPDQQGRRAFQNRDFTKAAELFTDPLWRGYALYRDGQYAEAIEVLDRVETAEAAFIQGLAALKSRSYRDGVRAFQTTLSRDPGYPGAAENLATAEEIVAFVEDIREQSDTGEDSGIGADEVVYDNEANRGAETQIEGPDEDSPAMLSTEQWMNTVDTRTGDFLKSRFALEAAQGQAGSPGDTPEPVEGPESPAPDDSPPSDASGEGPAPEEAGAE